VAFEQLFGFSVLEIKDQFISTGDIPVRDFDTLVDRLRHQKTIDEFKETLDNYFLEKYINREKKDFFHRCFEPLYRSSGTISISNLQEQTNLSKRQFERKFKEHAGISASVLRRLIRSNLAIARILRNYSVSDIIHDLRYFDQSHLIKDVKWYTSKTPKALYENYRNNIFRLGSTTFIVEQ
jgi:AraC-like DNA-binding protein